MLPWRSAPVILQMLEPGAYLPHRYPFQLLDRLVCLEQGSSAQALVQVSYDSPFPQILLVECVAQLAGIAAAHQQGEGGFLAALQRTRFGRMPRAGDCLEVSAHITATFGRLCQVTGQVTCLGDELLATELTLGTGSF